jgi:glycosyltransferase involved in cell wall biosynthesis
MKESCSDLRRPNASLTVLTAAYNGADYLDAFIGSALSQTVQADFLIRDDGSCDGTSEIIRSYNERVRLLEDDLGNVGVVENFNMLVRAAETPYIAFADQDDIWEPDKLEVELSLMREMEKRYGQSTPLLVHSDLSVCDSRGQIKASSLWRFQGLNPDVKTFSRLLVQNNVTGCTVVINKALKDLAFPVPKEAVMHDWWLALVASAAGQIGYIQRPLVRYRQHEKNQLGAVRNSLWSAWRRFHKIDPRVSLRASQRQARAFYDRYSETKGMEESVRLAKAYAEIGNKKYPQRVATIYKHGFWMQNFVRNAGLLLFI